MIALKVKPIYVGSRISPEVISRDEVKKTSYRDIPVFIASATQSHLGDLEHCLSLSPSKIFVEKGFLNAEERKEAKLIAGDIPSYVLSQHRYSSIFDLFMSSQDVNQVYKCTYTWKIENDNVSEFLYHVSSLDGYLRKKQTEIYNNNFGSYDIDDISSYSIVESPYRILKIQIQSCLYDATFKIGAYNNVVMKQKDSKQKIIMTSYSEDNLGKMIYNVLEKNSKIRLERI